MSGKSYLILVLAIIITLVAAGSAESNWGQNNSVVIPHANVTVDSNQSVSSSGEPVAELPGSQNNSGSDPAVTNIRDGSKLDTGSKTPDTSQVDNSSSPVPDNTVLENSSIRSENGNTERPEKNNPHFAEDEVIVRFNLKPGKEVDAESAGKSHKAVGATIKKDFGKKGLAGTQVVKIPPGLPVEKAIEKYKEDPNVLSAEPNYRIDLMYLPDDPDFPLQWGLRNTGETYGLPSADIHAVSAWSISTGYPGIIIAIPDTGIDLSHPDLAGNMWINPYEIPGNGIDDDSNGYIDDARGWDFIQGDPDPSDDNGHGTHVAGIAGAVGNNSLGIAGVMWNARILPLKVISADGCGYESDAIEAILYAKNAGVDIISISWGSYGESQALKDAIDSYPGLVVCAAGNSGQDNDVYPVYPASYSSGNIISVTATDEHDEIASFANYGVQSVDIAAPGVGIYSTVPGSGYEARSGTSMAAPFVAGVAGLVLSVNEDLGGEDLVAVLSESSDSCDSLEGMISSSGRVNAEAALLIAGGGPVVSPTQTTPLPTVTVTPTQNATGNEPQAAPINGEFIQYLQFGASTVSYGEDGDSVTGYIPSPVNRSFLTGQPLEFSEYSILSIPADYDLRDYGRATAVRNQGGCGSCWAFATYGSAESVLRPGETWDFSENNLKNTHGFDPGACDGGNADMSAAYLTRWKGPVREADDPYVDYPSSSPTGLSPEKHVQDILYIPGRSGSTNNDNIKNAVMTYGGVYTSFYWNDSYYNSNTRTYYYSGTASSNHAVTIMGWDDNKVVPGAPGNGAFLIKNSWGTGFGDGGYVWISYYDTRLGRSTNAVFLSESTNNYDYIYQYDPLGWVSSVGYSSNTAWAANVFTASRSEQLNAAGFYAASPGTAYEIYIYRNPSGGPINSQGPVSSQSGTIAIPGYHTIQLDNPVNLAAGQKFSIVVKLTTPGWDWPIPYECPYPRYSSAARAAAGQSYISASGGSWQDITTWTANSNVCVKGYTALGYNAALVSETIPARMFAGHPYDVAVTFRNNGAFTWSRDDNIVLRGRYPATFAFLDSIYVQLPEGTTVNPGDEYTFSFQMTAPKTLGTHHTEFKMIDLDDKNWFGDLVVPDINVKAPVYNAVLISETIPAQMYAGQSYNVAVTLRNNGAFPWSKDDNIVLRGRYPATFAFLESIFFQLPDGVTVNPGDEYTFNFMMTAPDTVGTHHTEFKMIDLDDKNWFGDLVVQDIQVENYV